ncbi:MAG TPA: DUF2752 domain-containing protein [Terriglobales bacterium]|nr:DUF2752 domain-containing protein [Terriglobales bacterium]
MSAAESPLPTLEGGLRTFRSSFFPAAADVYSLMFNPLASVLAPLILAAAAALPSNGLGIRVCLFRILSGLPCPGCGMTRALSSLLHGDGAAAFFYHPFVFAVLPALVLISVHGLLPNDVRGRLRRSFTAHQARLRPAYEALVYSFLAFGLIRMIVSWFAGSSAI